MRCISYCIATSYNISKVEAYFKKKCLTIRHHNVLSIDNVEGYDKVFIFSYGVVVFWSPEEDPKSFLNKLTQFQGPVHPQPEVDEFIISLNKVGLYDLYMPGESLETKLSISHAVAQSTKLGSFEGSLDKAYKEAYKLSEDLAKYGKIYLSNKEIRKKWEGYSWKGSQLTLSQIF